MQDRHLREGEAQGKATRAVSNFLPIQLQIVIR